MTELLRIRVRPYYLYHCDNVTGVSHFMTSMAKGWEIMEGLQGHITGFGVPQYVLTTRLGKIPIAEPYFRQTPDGLVLRNYRGQEMLVDDAAYPLAEATLRRHAAKRPKTVPTARRAADDEPRQTTGTAVPAVRRQLPRLVRHERTAVRHRARRPVPLPDREREHGQPPGAPGRRGTGRRACPRGAQLHRGAAARAGLDPAAGGGPRPHPGRHLRRGGRRRPGHRPDPGARRRRRPLRAGHLAAPAGCPAGHRRAHGGRRLPAARRRAVRHRGRGAGSRRVLPRRPPRWHPRLRRGVQLPPQQGPHLR